MRYDLWDVESGNRVWTCKTATEAVTLVRDLMAANAAGYVDNLSCAVTTGAGDHVCTYEGANILTLGAALIPPGIFGPYVVDPDAAKRAKEQAEEAAKHAAPAPIPRPRVTCQM